MGKIVGAFIICPTKTFRERSNDLKVRAFRGRVVSAFKIVDIVLVFALTLDLAICPPMLSVSLHYQNTA